MSKGGNWPGGRHAPQMVMVPVLGEGWHLNDGWFNTFYDHFVHECGFDGFHIPMQGHLPSESQKRLMRQADRDGLWVHLWMYGDQHDWPGVGKTAPNVLNKDREHQTNVLNQLKQFKNWSMGTGYDIQEWVDDEEQQVFYDFCRSIVPNGMFGARRLKVTYDSGDLSHEGPHAGNYAGYEWWAMPKSHMLHQCRQAIKVSNGLPVMWEERGRVRNEKREKDYVSVEQAAAHIEICVKENVSGIWGASDHRGSVSAVGSGKWANAAELKSIMKGRFPAVAPGAPPPPAPVAEPAPPAQPAETTEWDSANDDKGDGNPKEEGV